MLRSGKAHWITITGIAGLIALTALYFFSGETPSAVASRFMSALATGDVDSLMETSYYDGSKENLRKQWDYATKVAGPHYGFIWEIVNETIQNDKNATVHMAVTRGGTVESYAENVHIPMVKEEGKWKVDIRRVWRYIYPAWPR